jgi:Flp pilus assembly protein TadB
MQHILQVNWWEFFCAILQVWWQLFIQLWWLWLLVIGANLLPVFMRRLERRIKAKKNGK